MVLGLLSILKVKKYISQKVLDNFQKNRNNCTSNNEAKIGIETSNGSFGQGLSYGVGLSIANKIKKNNNKVVVMMGDGECYEGSVWEAAITATENNLGNLFAVIDVNGFQNDGKIGKNMDLKNLSNKWRGFGWNTIVCDGHNISNILKSFKKIKKNIYSPSVLICKTIKGKGVKFMENNNDWHHGRLTKNLYENAIKSLNDYKF